CNSAIPPNYNRRVWLFRERDANEARLLARFGPIAVSDHGLILARELADSADDGPTCYAQAFTNTRRVMGDPLPVMARTRSRPGPLVARTPSPIPCPQELTKLCGL